MFNTAPRCSNCLTSRTGKHPFLCTVCRSALTAKGVICNEETAKRSRQAWWTK